MQTAYSRASSIKVKRAALSALALLGRAQVRPQFVAAMTDKDDGLRTAAAEGLARLKDPADAPQLDQCLNDEKKMPPRLACAFGLVQGGRIDLGEASALRYLLNTLNSKAWKGVAEGYLVEAARTKQVRTSLEGIALGATKDEKMGLGRVLAASGDTDSQRIVEQLSRDPDADVMREGVRALRILRARLP
jgi:HEAT repeat protein